MRCIVDREDSGPLERASAMAMIVMAVSVPSWHLQNCHVEILVVILLELKYVLAFLHVEDRDYRISRAVLRVLDSLLGLSVIVTLMAIFF